MSGWPRPAGRNRVQKGQHAGAVPEVEVSAVAEEDRPVTNRAGHAPCTVAVVTSDHSVRANRRVVITESRFRAAHRLPQPCSICVAPRITRVEDDRAAAATQRATCTLGPTQQNQRHPEPDGRLHVATAHSRAQSVLLCLAAACTHCQVRPSTPGESRVSR